MANDIRQLKTLGLVAPLRASNRVMMKALDYIQGASPTLSYPLDGALLSQEQRGVEWPIEARSGRAGGA